MSEGIPGPSPRTARVHHLCEQVWELPDTERALLVRQRAGNDNDLAAAVLALLERARNASVGAGRAAMRDWLRALGSGAAQPAHDATHVSAAPIPPRPEPRDQRLPPTEERTLGDFQILRPIDEGGTGVVWLAHQKSLGRQVALKTYRARADSEAPRQQFLRAAQLAARLQHPHIVSTYTAGLEGDTLYYVMEYVEGVTLERLLRALKRFANDADETELQSLPPTLVRAIWPDGDGPGSTDSTSSQRLRARSTLLRRAFSYMVEAFAPVVEAIEYAHRQGIVHGDLKPANLIVDRAGRMLVIDFGLARTVSLIEHESGGAVAGTPQYMSPELVAGQSGAASRAVDVYALGATLYEVLALVPAYDGPSREAILARIATENPTPLREVNPRVHRDLGVVVERAMHRQPRRRYTTAGAMAEDLRRFLRRQPLSSTGSSLAAFGQRALHDHPLASVAAIVLLVAGAGYGAERGLAAISEVAASARDDELWRELEQAVAEARGRAATPRETAGRIEANLEHAADVLLQAGGRGIPADAVAARRTWLMQQAADIRIRAYVAAGEPNLAHQFLQEAEREGVDTRDLIADLQRSGALGNLDVETLKPANVTVSLRRVNTATNETEDAVVRSAPAPAAFAALFPGDYVVQMAQPGVPSIQFAVRVDAAMRTTARVPYAPSDVPPGMVYVGCSDTMEFVSGDHDTQYEIGSFGPQRRRLYRSFFLDRLEVRNREYAQFLESPDREHYVRDALHSVPAETTEPNPTLLLTTPLGWTIGKPAEGTEDQPVRLTHWRDAVAYAMWRQAELPTELEWEFAARGIGSRVFPYGDQFVLANHHSIRLADAGSHPRDVSVHGVLDMLGSVPELVYGPAGSVAFALRGASHNEQDPHACRLARTGRLAGAEEAGSVVVALALRITACVPELQQAFSSHQAVPFGFRCKRDAAGLELRKEPAR